MAEDSQHAGTSVVGETLAHYAGFTDNRRELSRYGLQGLVGHPRVMNYLSQRLAEEVAGTDFDFIAGNVVGGMVPGWQMMQALKESTGRSVPFVYVREGYKKGGHGELEVGTRNNPLIRDGMTALLVDVEEDGALFRQRVQNSTDGLRDKKYNVNHVATLASPAPEIDGVEQVYLDTVQGLVNIAQSGKTRELGSVPLKRHSYDKADLRDIGLAITRGGALEIRDVDGGEEPFQYRSGHHGPGYLMIKGLVGQPDIMNFLVQQLAVRIAEKYGDSIDGIAANATGGVIPGWQLRNELELLTGREVGYVVVTGTRVDLDKADPKELIIGLDSPNLTEGANMLVVEELVNFAETTTMSAKLLRRAGFEASHAATTFSYDHKNQRAKLHDSGVELTKLITLQQQLDIAEEHFDTRLVDSYREFLDDTEGWQTRRGIQLPG